MVCVCVCVWLYRDPRIIKFQFAECRYLNCKCDDIVILEFGDIGKGRVGTATYNNIFACELIMILIATVYNCCGEFVVVFLSLLYLGIPTSLQAVS